MKNTRSSHDLSHWPGTIGELFNGNIYGIEHRDKQVGQRDLLGTDKLVQVAVVESELAAAGELNGVVFGTVGRVRVGGAPEDEGAVEHVAVAYRSDAQALGEVGVL